MFGPILLIVLAIVACESMAMTCVKKYNSTKEINYMLFAILSYSVLCFLLNMTYNNTGIAKVNILWSGISVAASTLLGVMIFKEKLHTHDFIAIGLIASGIFILKTTE